MTDVIYEASVYSRVVKYTNFKGKTQETELFFALDPLQLMQVIAGFKPPKPKKSGNPAKQNEEVAITDEEQLKFVRDLCERSAGFPSDDGETWEPFENFADTIAGKAFLTKLASSDGDRREFTEKVILAPFRAFVEFATADPSNTQKDIQQFKRMLGQLENIFQEKADPEESLEDRRARLAAELAAIEDPGNES